ncbi:MULTISPECIES: hypothetical protein [unclassified Chryseobacterium]|uniref:hypothetical protein n=1 Tax=unclassified Chryseobacterium TaxID=2593645 RepID=UPI00226A9EDE|nr:MULTISPECIES: hypothetical protein [unclassified Chryseobacterium]
MWINCKIISDNLLIYNKFKEFITKTPFFIVCEEANDAYEDIQIIIWDIDSIDLDKFYIAECINNGKIVIIIHSLFSKEIIINWFDENLLQSIGAIHSNILYQQFVEEISKIVDRKCDLDSQKVE